MMEGTITRLHGEAEGLSERLALERAEHGATCRVDMLLLVACWPSAGP